MTESWIQRAFGDRQRKDPTNGSDRRAQEDSRDPGASTSATQNATASDYACGTCATFHSHERACPALIPETPSLPVEQSDVPILAKREAFLNMEWVATPFTSITNDHGSFGILTKAYCSANYQYSRRQGVMVRHDAMEAPHPDCTCGFYAVPIDKPNFYGYPNAVVLLVEFSGKVIEHDLGFRAEWQKVVECQTPPCIYCGRAADRLLVSADMALERFVCDTHRARMDPGQIYLSVDDLAHRIGVPVTRLTY